MRPGTAPLLVGAMVASDRPEPQGFLNGEVADLRPYRGLLDGAELTRLWRETVPR